MLITNKEKLEMVYDDINEGKSVLLFFCKIIG